ncbi:hypothetical protein EUX98_g6557 [Antrodiella citrinella]|uniref:Pre-mRNA-splicing factor CEF1 n=1 Tax=Antrodiella citrinella TaxID=2447956 RepID=A0A4S4MW71_9APHY|nr:hypothetical protein EUX98_g6557 [Antrodiella citrinella]
MASIVSIVGGHGKIALRLAALLHPTHKVFSIIRTADHKADITAANATPVIMSLEDHSASKFTEFFEATKTDVVVFSAGAGGKGGPDRTKKVDFEGAVKIFDAIEGVKDAKPRLILVSAIDSRDVNIVPEHYTPEDIEAAKKAHEGALKNYYHWKYQADKDLVKRTAFPWTILMPGGLLDDAGKGTANIGRTGLTHHTVTRDDVAATLALLLDRPGAAGLALNIIGGTTPLKESLDAAIKERANAWSMVRIIIKGGVWKNTEDEVLKAAIAKYGKNQWARISSLLVRKTPKQCKARWYEWLDPSIKKTEWSKTEDEKLLHLAKLMPTQWRTIAPIVGRTATQCLERYQKLLDEAEQKESEELGLAGPGDEAGPSADDVRRLRPGEIDPDPETKPARPDPIDMDEDEKEMLSEARARLANTQGKKAKRKARERQLEEARRLAVLQKKRELKAAGIIMRHKTKKKGMDYNADIPFEKKPAPGFYDTADEQARQTTAPVGQSLRRLENKRKPEEEDAERKKRQRRNADGKGGEAPHQTKFVAARDAQIQKLKEAESIGRRRKLVLPSAQVGETELEDIVKIGQAGENAKALVAGGSEAAGRLLSDYEGLERAKMARTPRTAPQQDNIMTEARNLRNMTIQQTPLLGDENTPMHPGLGGGTGFESATPVHNVAFTPNPLATPLHPSSDAISATPRGDPSMIGATPLRTPLRDNLSINPEDQISVVGDTPREQRMRVNSTKRALQAGFSALPKPENNFELLVPEDEGEDESDERQLSVEDAAERDAKLQRLREEQERREVARRSQAVQRGLPRPANVDLDGLLRKLKLSDAEAIAEADSAAHLIHTELAQLLEHDAIAHPIPGTLLPGGTRSSYSIPEDDTIAAAKAAVQAEIASALGYPTANEVQLQEGLATLAQQEEIIESHSWSAIRQQLLFDAKTSTWVDPEELSEEERIAGLSVLLNRSRDTMASEAQKTGKLEKKLGVVLGGYQARSRALTKKISDTFEELQRTKLEYESFSILRTNESATGPRRVSALQEEVGGLERREQALQRRYAELDSERRELESRISGLEDKVMAEAEALNEAALAEMENEA